MPEESVTQRVVMGANLQTKGRLVTDVWAYGMGYPTWFLRLQWAECLTITECEERTLYVLYLWLCQCLYSFRKQNQAVESSKPLTRPVIRFVGRHRIVEIPGLTWRLIGGMKVSDTFPTLFRVDFSEGYSGDNVTLAIFTSKIFITGVDKLLDLLY